MESYAEVSRGSGPGPVSFFMKQSQNQKQHDKEQTSPLQDKNSNPADTFSPRCPQDPKQGQEEYPSPFRGRHGNYQGRNDRSRRPADRKPTLAQFAPDLMKLQTSASPQARNTFGAQADRRRYQRAEPENPLRSPLNRQQKTWDETSPLKGRFQGNRPRGNYRSGRPVHQKPARTHFGPDRTTRLRTPPSKSLDADRTDEDLDDNASNRCVRKRLWADEVDEAFVDGDDFEDDKSGEAPRPPLTDQQLARRQKDVDYGKSTKGYQNYVQQVPREKRGKRCPVTPDKHANHSRRKWDYLIQKWRRELHNYDNPSEQSSERSGRTPSKLNISQNADVNTTPSSKLPSSPSSSLTSTPSDLGYVGTPDSNWANLSWQQLDEEDTSLQENDDIQLMTDAVDAKLSVDYGMKAGAACAAEQMENEGLEDFVQKLEITKMGESNGEDAMEEEPSL